MSIVDCKIHPTVKIWHPELVNLYGCEVDAGTKIGSFVEIGPNVKIGKDCKIQSFVFIPEGIFIGSHVFVGPHTVFCNTKYPMKSEEYKYTIIEDRAIIGANCTILPGLRIGMNSIIGAGSVVTKNVIADQTVMGNPAVTKPYYATDCKYFYPGSSFLFPAVPLCGVSYDHSLVCKCEDYEAK